MGQMPAGGQRHGEDFVPWVAPSEIDRFVGVGARVRLDIGVVGMKQATSAINTEALDAVNIVLTPVIAKVWQDFVGDFFFRPTIPSTGAVKTGVALGIFVGQDRSHGFENCARDVIFARDEF